MKKTKLVLLAMIVIVTTAMPTFGISPPIVTPITVDPLIPSPILDNPIIMYPLMPAFLNQKDVTAIPIYRLYKADLDKHNYTTSAMEKADLIASGWVDDGIVSYVSPFPMKGFIPLYKNRIWNTYYSLSTEESTFWPSAGVIGYISAYDLGDHDASYELVKELSEGDDFWDTSKYYDDTYWQISPYSTIPKPKPGYNLTSKRLNTWEEADLLQFVRFFAFETSMTGNTNYAIRFQILRPGGTVTLMYSSDNGETWKAIFEDHAMTSTIKQVSWQAPNLNSSQMKLRALWTPEGGSSPAAWDTSESFTVSKDPSSPDFVLIDPGIFILNLAPAAPTNLTADPALVTKEINLYWEDNAATETGYVVERRSEGGSFTAIATLDINENHYKDLAISTNVEYAYRVKGKGASFDSGYSNVAAATHTLLIAEPLIPDGFILPEFPDPPENVRAGFTDGSNSEVMIEWDAPAGDYTGFKVEKNAGSGWVDLGTTTEDDHNYVDVDLAGLSGLVFYRVKTYDEALTSSPADPVFVNLDDGQADPGPVAPADIYDGSQSGWAEAEILQAYNNGLTYPGILYDYGRAITREEFCTLAVKLYENLTGLTPVPGANPFNDTTNPEVLKAYSLGMINGVSATQFAPALNVTRQEMCVMLYRALGAAGRDTSVDPTAAFPFTDAGDIASWAINEVKFCNQKGIMNGTSPTTIDPLLNTPREQAIILAGRTYNAFETP